MPHRSLVLSFLCVALLAVPGASHAQPALHFVEFEVDGANGVDLLDGAFGVTASGDGRHVYVTGSIDDSITVFARDAATGALSFASATTPGLDALDSPLDVVLSPDEANLYATGTISDSVAVFTRDPVSGALGFVERKKDGVDGVTGLNGARASLVSPDGAHVYVASLFNAVAIFARDAATGALTQLGTLHDGVGGIDGLALPVAIATSPGGDSVYVAGNGDDAIAVFARDAATGLLAFVEAETASLDGPSGVVVSPDGRHAYVTNGVGNSLVRFDRDAGTGALSFVEAITNGVGEPPAEGLDGASEVAMTPDGRFVYVAGETASTLAMFQRDAATGALQFVEVEHSGENGFDGFTSPFGLAIAAGGRNLYVTGLDADAVAVLAPEPDAAAIAAAAVASFVMLAGARARR